MHVARWGNSLAVRLPAELVKELGLKAGDHVHLEPTTEGFSVRRQPSTEEILSELRRFRGRLPGSEQLSRDEANAR